MARNDETGVPEFLIPFQVDRSWYERYWWHDSAPRKARHIRFLPSYPFAAAIDQASRRAG
jgi:hypothetical protein